MAISLVGRTFGRLTVLALDHKSASLKPYWRCVCQCGKETVTRGDHLTTGATKSCGCLNKEIAARTGHVRGKLNTKHGGEGTRLYTIWSRMKERCMNPRHVHYTSYGGRGITICQEWVSDFAAFREWAHAAGYSDELSLDRIDNAKGYDPANCRWATAKEQGRNRRNNRVMEGKCLSEWIEVAVVSERTVRNRLKKGLAIQDACFTPARKSNV